MESMEFCLKLRGSEACVLEDLVKAINLVHIRRDLVESGHALLNHAYHVQQDYERYSCVVDPYSFFSFMLDIKICTAKGLFSALLPIPLFNINLLSVK